MSHTSAHRQHVPVAASPEPPVAQAASRRAGRGVLAILGLALFGTLAELLLLEHYEDWKQWVPLVALAVTGVVVAWQSFAPGNASRRALQLLMMCLVVAGIAGIVLHLRGNLEFEQELNPGVSGFALWLEVARGATPALAPGSLIPFGLLGLLYASRSSNLLPQDS